MGLRAGVRRVKQNGSAIATWFGRCSSNASTGRSVRLITLEDDGISHERPAGRVSISKATAFGVDQALLDILWLTFSYQEGGGGVEYCSVAYVLLLLPSRSAPPLWCRPLELAAWPDGSLSSGSVGLWFHQMSRDCPLRSPHHSDE